MNVTLKKLAIVAVLVTMALTLLFAGAGFAEPTLTDLEQLGKSIYFDMSLSINMNQACASCHVPAWGWTGPDPDINAHGSVYEGSIPGSFGNRKPPSAAYATLSPILGMDKKGTWVGGNFWDGRATGEVLGNPAADQALGPFLNPKEQALPDSACVVYRVCNPVVPADYLVDFEDVWGADACEITWPADVEATCATENATVSLSNDDRAKSNEAYGRIGLSIAAFEASPEVNAFTSKYDYSLVDMAVLTKLERKGFALFQGKGKCKLCHISSGAMPLFTDYTFDNLGLPKNPENPFYDEQEFFIDYGLGGFLGDSAEDGKHKVPTLRNVDLRPSTGDVKAYGHNGFFKSLEGIVHFYNTRDVLDTCPDDDHDYTEAEALAENCWPAPEVAVNVNTAELGDLGLTEEEELAIVAFLKTLSDGYLP